MKQLLVILFSLVLFSCKGQKDSANKTSAADKLVGYYNRVHYDSIFYLFSKDMKEGFPLNGVNDFFSNMKESSGEILSYKFIEKNRTYDRYKAELSNGIYWLNISLDAAGKINGLYINEYDGSDAPPVRMVARNSTKMILPFEGEWFVFWGGDTKAQNYHVVNKAQKNAFDIVIVDEKGRSFKTDGKNNEDYYAFGQKLIAPCDAEVISVIEGVKDNVPGEMNPAQATGNSVVLKTAANEYLVFAHFKMNSIQVKMGDKVKQGQLLGLCGNSGNSSEAHLHFHIQDKESMMSSTGIKCYFEKLIVNGIEKKDYSPVRGERIKNVSN
jgi:murein DD-endopeptidase MepM/ murein hydrolase activator NlpD